MKYRATVRNREFPGARLVLSESDDFDRLKEFAIDVCDKYLKVGTTVEVECNTCHEVHFCREMGYG